MITKKRGFWEEMILYEDTKMWNTVAFPPWAHVGVLAHHLGVEIWLKDSITIYSYKMTWTVGPPRMWVLRWSWIRDFRLASCENEDVCTVHVEPYSTKCDEYKSVTDSVGRGESGCCVEWDCPVQAITKGYNFYGSTGGPASCIDSGNTTTTKALTDKHYDDDERCCKRESGKIIASHSYHPCVHDNVNNCINEYCWLYKYNMESDMIRTIKL